MGRLSMLFSTSSRGQGLPKEKTDMSNPCPKEPTPGLSTFSLAIPNPDAYSGAEYSNNMSLLATLWL